MADRVYYRKMHNIGNEYKSACQMYNVLLSRWQHGLISRDEMEESIRLHIRPVFFYDEIHGSANTSLLFMNGKKKNGVSSLPTNMEDYWNKSGKTADEFNDISRWTETDEYGEWEAGRWEGDTWIPDGYSGMIHVDDSLPTEAKFNGDNRADAWMYKTSGYERYGSSAAWMIDFNYDLPGTKADWSEQRVSGEYGQTINFGNMYNESIVVFSDSPGFGDQLYKPQYESRDDTGTTTNSLYKSTTGIVNVFEGVDPVLYLTHWEHYAIPDFNQDYQSRQAEPIKAHPLLLTPDDVLFQITNQFPMRTEIIYPKEMMFRVERVGWNKMLFLCFSKVLYTNLSAEFNAVDFSFYSELLSPGTGAWLVHDAYPGYQTLCIDQKTQTPQWQLACAYMYTATAGDILPSMWQTHVFNTYHTYNPTVGQPRWQRFTSDLLRMDLSHTVSNLVDYSDIRDRGLRMQVGGVQVATNDETELFTHGVDTYDGNDTPVPTITLFMSAPTQITSAIPLYIPVMDEKTGILNLQVDGGGKQRQLTLHIHDNRMNYNTPLYILGGIGEETATQETFIFDDTTLQNFVTDPGWEQWASDSWESEKWDDQYTYTRFDVTITHPTLPTSPPHFHKDFGTDYFGREFLIEFEYTYRDQGASQASFCPFIVGDHTRWPSTFNTGDQIMYILCDEDGVHTLERANTAESATIGSLVSDTKYYVRFTYGPIQSSQFIGTQVDFYTNSTRTGTPAFSAYIRMDDKWYIEKFDELAIGAVVSTGTYSFILENLWLEGSVIGDTIPMMVDGHTDTGMGVKLMTEGLSYPSNSYLTMTLFGGTLGGYWHIGDQPLFLYFDNTLGEGLQMVAFNDDRPPSVNSGLPLFIGGVYKTETGSVPLFLQNDGIYETTPLFIYGAGTYPGYFSLTDDLRCYVHRPLQGSVVPLLVYNDTPGLNTFMNMRIRGILGTETQGCTLVMPNVKDGSPNTFLKMQLTGAVQVVSEATMALPETLANLNATQPLICYHSGGAPNSYVKAFIDGVYKSGGYTTLSMPNVVHLPTLDAPTYIRGY